MKLVTLIIVEFKKHVNIILDKSASRIIELHICYLLSLLVC
jgi:hypothetical protein